MKIQKATKKDFKKISEIYKDSFSEPPYKENWKLKEAFKKINFFSKYCDIWKAEEKNEIIAFLVINSHQWKQGEIIFGEDIAVKKEFRNQKIATKLLKFIFDYYKKKGYKKFMGIINKDAKSFGLIKKLNLTIQKFDLLVEKNLR